MSEEKKAARSLAGIAGIVAVATLISKVFGLVRQVAIAAAFGVGPAFDAYNYAYVIPGFLPILLGGINGPFHSQNTGNFQLSFLGNDFTNRFCGGRLFSQYVQKQN